MKKILIAYDGSDAAKKAIDMTLKCSSQGDEILILTVIPAELVESSFTKMLLPTIDLSGMVQSGSFKEKAMERIRKVAKEIEGKVEKVEVLVETGDAADEILLTGKKHEVDIIVMGYKGF